ncbi:restriction endonuclease subunit S [Vibrio parahaemolyticus]|uniref:restriction endonuclease subunit S n=2 Tax=Vibrio parahaemolyticus TaxID=670 RepID=UPI0004135DBE|nr:restriction endonuclease subunit S [Vibrio parahaemolyticus]EGQ8805272.1 restriction endonuclease subunit S [Vibrio parahaemolyticus]EGQ8887900.1 restriction endonuclease subunit S [Vibrio parahaemolyticus]EGQ8962962.1 restriction endonuclease subunit S [Vibrio parahaemolyticus]EGR2850423.1 restriction endonuclease subunit S [Vibrio parahaemolyticus]EGR3166692.1 restriction endonuclease subunit S [Vibrio parahaemolyticus]
MSWPLVKLGEVAKLINGDRGKNYPSKGSFVDEGIPFINAGCLSNEHTLIEGALNYITEDKFDSLRSGKVEKGDILFCLRGSLGKFALVDTNMKGAIASSLVIIRANEKVHIDYLKHYLGSFLCQREIQAYENGAAQPNLSATDLKNFEIPLPPLAEQKRIAAILDKADAIRQKRKQAIELADEFLRSVFLDMFGDPVTNPKGWEVEKFGNVGSLDRGKSKHRPRNDPKLLGGLHPLVQTGDVANSKGYLRSYTSTYSDFGLAQSKKWPAGTLCITIAANIAKTGILTFDACFPDSVVGFTPNSKTTTEYVQAWISFLQKILEANAPESAQKNINLAILRDLNIPVPPVSEQNKFTMIVEKVNSVLNRTRASKDSNEQLFDSLSQKAFSGQL